MNSRNKKLILLLCQIALCLEIGFFLGVRLARASSPKNLEGAIRMARLKVDSQYGNNAFLYGLRRVLKDGEKDFYAFQVKVFLGKTSRKLLVNVDMTKKPCEVTIDSAETYDFRGDWAFDVQ